MDLNQASTKQRKWNGELAKCWCGPCLRLHNKNTWHVRVQTFLFIELAKMNESPLPKVNSHLLGMIPLAHFESHWPDFNKSWKKLCTSHFHFGFEERNDISSSIDRDFLEDQTKEPLHFGPFVSALSWLFYYITAIVWFSFFIFVTLRQYQYQSFSLRPANYTQTQAIFGGTFEFRCQLNPVSHPQLCHRSVSVCFKRTEISFDREKWEQVNSEHLLLLLFECEVNAAATAMLPKLSSFCHCLFCWSTLKASNSHLMQYSTSGRIK